MHPSPAATRTVRQWTRSALASEGGTPCPPETPTNLPAPDLLAALSRQRLAEVLGPHTEALGLPGDVRAAVARRLRADRAMLAVRLMEIGRVESRLSSAGARLLLVKGPALAVQTTGNPAARGHGDIDLFVSPDDVLVAMQALEAGGWVARPPHTVPGSWGWRHMIDKAHEMTFDGVASTVDLHWRLDPTHDALPSFESAWSRRVPVDLGGHVSQTLHVADAMNHACHHAAKDEWRWVRSLVDVHRLGRCHDAWPARPLSRVERASLRVTEECVGLPPEATGRAGQALGPVPDRAVARALAAQGRPLHPTTSFPGVGTARLARYRLSASHSADDVARTAMAVLAPLASVDGLDSPTAWGAVPRLVLRQAWWVLRRLSRRVTRQPDPAQPSAASSQ